MKQSHFSRWVIVIAVNREHGKRDVQILVLVVHRTKQLGSTSASHSTTNGESSVGRYVKSISPEPRQYWFSSSIVLFSVFLDGLFASNKSPPSKRKST